MKHLAIALAMTLVFDATSRPSLAADEGSPWAATPSGPQLAGSYPDFALRNGVEGRVTLSCEVGAGGLLKGCQVASETPVGFHFGEAALTLAPLFRMGPTSMGAPPADGATIRIPIRYAPPAPAAQPQDLARLQALAPHALADPIWVALPSGRDVAEVYPAEGVNQQMSAVVVMGCAVKANGGLRACRVLNETPYGQGFGPAALRLAGRFKAYDRARDGAPTAGAEVVFPVRFEPPR